MKSFFYGILLVCIVAISNLSGERIQNIRELDLNNNGIYEPGEVDPNVGYQSGPCRCPVTRFVPQYHCETKCIQEPYTVTKKCCRYVDQPYTKRCCRMVPEYYDEVCTRKVPEYYDECETKYRNRYIQEQKCTYRPCTSIEETSCDGTIQGGVPLISSYGASVKPSEDKIIYNSIKGKIASQKILDDKERVDIAVQNGDVRITGHVITEEQKDRVGRLVSTIQGVRDIDNQLLVDRPDLIDGKSVRKVY